MHSAVWIVSIHTLMGLLFNINICIISVAAKADFSITLSWLCPNIRLDTFRIPAKAKLDKILIGLFCTEISIKSLKPLNAKALISVMLLESRFNFFNCFNPEKARKKKENVFGSIHCSIYWKVGQIQTLYIRIRRGFTSFGRLWCTCVIVLNFSKIN